MARHLVMLLGAGWILLPAPEGKPPTTPVAQWARGEEYDTAYECERGRSAAVRERLQKTGGAPLDVESRYRCVRVEQLPR